jgi:cytochrome c-type biogenesis protein CcmH
MGFWIAAGALSLAVAFLILLANLCARGDAAPAAAYDLQVYRDQLKELDRDLERGVLTEAEAARARTEVSRRILEADRALQKRQGGRSRRSGLERWIVAGGLLAVVAGAVGVYMQIGAPGYPDLPLTTRIAILEEARANRPDQAAAETQVEMRRPALPAQPEREELVAQFARDHGTAPRRRRRAWRFWPRTRRRWAISAPPISRRRLIELLGEEATGLHYIDLAEMMILAAGGYVSPEAEEALLQRAGDASRGTAPRATMLA